MPSHRPTDSRQPQQNAGIDPILESDLSPLDAIITELTRLDREIVTMRSRLDVFSKTIDRQEAQVESLRSFVTQSEVFGASLDTLQTDSPKEA